MDCRCENHLKFCSLPKLPALFQTPTFSPKKEKKEGKPWNLAFPTLTHTFLILVGCSLTNFLMLYIFWKVRPRTFTKFNQIKLKQKDFVKGRKQGPFAHWWTDWGQNHQWNFSGFLLDSALSSIAIKHFHRWTFLQLLQKICLCLCFCVFVFHAGSNLYKAQILDKTFSFSASLLRVHLPCCLVRLYRRLACNAKYHPGYCGHQSLPLRLLFVFGRIYHKLLQISSWQSTILVQKSSNLKFRN